MKPENVLIEDTASGGRVKVADFGLAKAISADTQHTVTGGVLIGTVSYLAPELVVDGRADARADVYAAGVVLYEMLTGHKPHEGESPIAVAYKHVHTDVPAPSSVVPGIPAYVDALVARATSRDRTQRPADAGVLLHQIHRVAQALRDGVREDPELVRRPGAAPGPAGGHPAGRPPTPRPSPSTRWRWPTTATTNRSRSSPRRGSWSRSAPRRWTGARSRRRRARRTIVRTRGPRRSRRGPLLLVLALLLAVAGGVGAYWFGVARYTTTPGVIGLAQAKAVDRLEDAGLTADVGTPAYSETVPAGEVVATDPDPGSRVLGEGTVTLTVSLGKERYDVPDLAGKTEDQAQDALAEAHLSFGKSVERWNEVGARPAPSSAATPRPARPSSPTPPSTSW